MKHALTIAGNPVEIEWTQETARRYAFRMGEIGGSPTPAQLRNPKTVTTALFKMLWCLLPKVEFAKYETPEELFAVVDHETESAGIFTAINGIFSDWSETAEKKSTGMKSHSPELNSGSPNPNGTPVTQDKPEPT